MSWIVAGIAGGAGLGLLKSADQAHNQKAEMLANAAQIQYSPWTGMKSQVQGPQGNSALSALAGGALQGGLTGALMGKQLAPGAAAAGAPGTPAATGQAQFDSQAYPQPTLYGNHYNSNF